MFDPLQAVLASIIVEGLKALSVFLKAKGFPFEIEGWASVFSVVVANLFIAFGNVLAGQFPASFQAWLPLVVKFLLSLAATFGVYELAFKPLKRMAE